jgi:hypothetical protein
MKRMPKQPMGGQRCRSARVSTFPPKQKQPPLYPQAAALRAPELSHIRSHLLPGQIFLPVERWRVQAPVCTRVRGRRWKSLDPAAYYAESCKQDIAEVEGTNLPSSLDLSIRKMIAA